MNVSVPEQGIHLAARSVETWSNDVAVSVAAQKSDVVVIPITPMHVSTSTEPGLIFGFSSLTEQEADIGTNRLAKMFDRERFQ